VKRAFDPAGVLNPGVKVAEPGQVPLGDVKYDPGLAPLPAAARRALDHVAERRDYAAPRLELLERFRGEDGSRGGAADDPVPEGADTAGRRDG
jgi:hypothetical protein